MHESTDRGLYWRRRGRWLSRRINLAVWLGRFVPLLAGLSLPAAIGLLLLRRLGGDEHLLWIFFTLSLSAAGAAAAWAVRGSFYSAPDALVHLDIVHGLHNRLTSASVG